MPIEKVIEAFTEAQISIINELGYIQNELVAGRQEEAFTAIRDLKDELIKDVNISRGRKIELIHDLDNQEISSK